MKRAVPASLVLALMPAVAGAQVTTNAGALDRLGAPHKAVIHHARPAARTTAHQVRHPGETAHVAHVAHAAPHGSGVAARIGAPPPIPLHPPAPPVIAPPALRVELHPPPPPPAVPVDAKAVGAATPIEGGVRLTFGTDSAAVNATTDDALHGISTLLKAEPGSVADIEAYASGTADDPSTPRRLSLERALAARAVLIHDGIDSTRIYARAMGTAAAPASDPVRDGPADRLDITVRRTDNGPGTAAPAMAARQ